MRKFGVLGMWIRSFLTGPPAVLLALLILFWLWRAIYRRRTGNDLRAITWVPIFALALCLITLPYPAVWLEKPLLGWAERLADEHSLGQLKKKMLMESELGASSTPAVIVLGGGMINRRMVSSTSLQRIEHGIRVWRQFPQAIFIFSEGGLEPRSVEWLKRYLLFRGIPTEQVVIEQEAATTQENLENCALVLADQNLGPILLVTSQRHIPRAYLTARRYGLQPALSFVPEQTEFDCAPTWESMRHLAAVLNEYVGLAGYAVAGWL